MTNRIYGVLSLSFSVVLLVIAIRLFGNHETLIVLRDIKGTYLLASISIAFLIFIISGIQISILASTQDVFLGWKGVVFFPLTMAFWGFVIPLQGALLFSTIYFKSKFKRTLSTGISVTLFLYMITFSLSGVVGLVFILVSNRMTTSSVLILTLLSAVPIMMAMLNQPLISLTSRINFSSGLTNKILKFTLSVSESVIGMARKPRLMVKVAAIKIFKTVVVGVWYSVIARGLGFEIGFTPLVLLSLVAELALVVKITPGNLGINQLLSGITMSFMDFNPEWGVLISLVASGSALVLVFTLGVYGNYLFMRDYGIDSFSEMWHKLKH